MQNHPDPARRRTATRLALGAGAVTAATVLGTAGPAAAATAPHAKPHPATQAQTKSRPTAPAQHVAAAHPKARTPAQPKTTTTASTTPKARTSTPKARTTGAPKAKASPRATNATQHQAARSGGRTSENWSGYSQTSRQLGRPVTAVSGSWTVPTTSQQVRGRSEAASDWIGIGGGRSAGAPDPTLVQAGVTTTVGRSGYASHYTWIETLPGDAVTTPLQARSGDRMTVAISRSGVDRWRMRLDNRSTGHHWTTTVRYHSAMRSGSWISERPAIGGADTHLPKRKALTYSGATVNGRATHFRPDQRITMTDGGRRVATPTAAEGNGSSFTVCSYSTRC